MGAAKKADFSGWATKAGLECSDGRTIMRDAFAHQDTLQVPLVWSHRHDGVENVLGHVILENRQEGVYAYGYINDSDKGRATRKILEHGDVDSLSIYANQLIEKAVGKTKQVIHGMIREVSLVLAGANPEAKIDWVAIRHSDDPDDITLSEDTAVIKMGIALEHSHPLEDEVVEHADDEEDKTVQDVLDTLNEEQSNVVNYLLEKALEEKGSSAAHSDLSEDEDNSESDESGAEDQSATTEDDESDNNNDTEDSESDDAEGDLAHQEGTDMSRTNVFEQNAEGTVTRGAKLSHDQMQTILDDAKKPGMTLRDSFLAHAGEYGIEDIDLLFPDAKAVSNQPEFISRRMEWVAKVLGGTKHLPFAKIKTLNADITAEEARAKGYVKGTKKVEEVFGLLKRSTGPTTIYKKQKLDRDDILDITDLDVVAWLKMEMRIMLEEEIARAILVGDGRSNMNSDKVKDPSGATSGDGIRSILNDDDLYVIKKTLPANVSHGDAIKGIIRARNKYRGSGTPTLFISGAELTEMMLLEDKFGRALYGSRAELAAKLDVESIVPVDLFDEYDNLFCILVNLMDYSVGSNRGGELTSFQDFDIDFNQEKYLTETRVSGALTKPYSAVVVYREVGTEATPAAPSYDGATHTITVPTTTGVNYLIDDEVVTGNVVITSTTEVEADAKDGYFIAPGTTDSWTYTY